MLGKVLKDVFCCRVPVVAGVGIYVDKPFTKLNAASVGTPWDAGTNLLQKFRPDTARELGAVEPPREIGTE